LAATNGATKGTWISDLLRLQIIQGLKGKISVTSNIALTFRN
jgi:hypothetical protein